MTNNDKNIKTRVVSITPKLAKEWLEKTKTRNRRLNAKMVERFASDMLRGAWKLNGETIKFDEEGNIIDGQHRLQAVVASDTTIQSAVASNIQTEDIYTVDQGKNRTFGDTLQIRGEINTNNLAAAAKALYEFEKQSVIQGKINHDILIETIQRNSEIREAVACGQVWKATGLRPAPTIAAVYLTRRANLVKANDFEDSLVTGAGLGIDDPRLALRNYGRVWRDSKAKGTNNEQTRDHIAAYLKAWNHWIQRKPLRLIRLIKSDYYPVILDGIEYNEER